MAEKYIDAVLFTGLPRPDSLDVNAARPRGRWPSQCAVCHGWGTQRICGDCRQRFAADAPRCARCALQVPNGTRLCGTCMVNPPPFEHSTAAVDYAYPWDSLITRFKFHGALDLAPALAHGLARSRWWTTS
jgi:predicted amidophosphoribosyltransferase